MSTTLWISLAIGILIILLGIVFFLSYKYRGKKHETDYYSFFVMGIVWLPFGIIMIAMKNSIGHIFFILGLVYLAIGLVNKDKWKSRKEILSHLTEKQKQIRYIIFGILLLILVIGVAFFYFYNKTEISSFEDCINAGYPAMESYPRQCTDRKNTWTEEVEGLTPDECEAQGRVVNIVGQEPPYCELEEINLGEVTGLMCDCVCCVQIPENILQIAQNSECTEQGELTENYSYNENSKTWWIDLIPFEENPNCNPACVINTETLETEINWRCTGLID
ncbi:hypothetical protein ACFL0X_00535 [Nanoarchaeota archaeon]